MVIRSAIFNIAFIVWTAIVGGLGLPFSFAHGTLALYVARTWAHVTLWLLKVICGITHEVKGRENIPNGAAIIASKHQSAWDTVIFWSMLRKPVFVLKKELIYIPIFGWQLVLLKGIYIDRKAGTAAMKRMLREARARTDEGYSIIIFPEGTRTAAGSSNAYHPGIAALYHHLQLPVVPVALNSGRFWGRQAFVKKPGVITIEFLPAIEPGIKSRDFIPLLKERIETASMALLKD
jgi:1-acyl-sn-glycerol-3-phosphate acyltransferase